jgi:hypothetical protein
VSFLGGTNIGSFAMVFCLLLFGKCAGTSVFGHRLEPVRVFVFIREVAHNYAVVIINGKHSGAYRSGNIDLGVLAISKEIAGATRMVIHSVSLIDVPA